MTSVVTFYVRIILKFVCPGYLYPGILYKKCIQGNRFGWDYRFAFVPNLSYEIKQNPSTLSCLFKFTQILQLMLTPNIRMMKNCDFYGCGRDVGARWADTAGTAGLLGFFNTQ